jgi:glucose/arabinose dehydrogenase
MSYAFEQVRESHPVRHAATVLSIAAMMAVIATPSVAEAPRSPTPKASEAPIRATVVATGLEHPWGLAFLPNGEMLVTERAGRLRVIDRNGQVGSPSPEFQRDYGKAVCRRRVVTILRRPTGLPGYSGR